MTDNKKFFLFYLLTPFIIFKIILVQYLGFGNGIPFGGIHHPDHQLLNTDLIETIKFWHYSPPLINFVLGLSLKFFDGNLFYVDKLYFIYNLIISAIMLLISYYFCLFYEIKKKYTLILSFFIILNPNIVFYENFGRPIYSHTIAFLFTLICFFSHKYFYTKKNKYLFGIFFTTSVMIYTWTLFQPILIILVFIFFYFFFKIRSKLLLTLFVCFLTISIIPFIKNKLVFNFFGSGSHLWIQLSQTLPGHRDKCLQAIKNIIATQRYNYAPEPEKLLKLHPSLREKPLWEPENHLNTNHISYITNQNICKNWVLNTLINDPMLYPKKRIESFLASHSKFAFEFVVGSPENLKKILSFENMREIKRIKQTIVLSYMIFFYFFIFRVLIKSKNTKFKNFLLLISLYYLYILIIGHLTNGYEQERMMYGGFFMHFIFFITLIKKGIYNDK